MKIGLNARGAKVGKKLNLSRKHCRSEQKSGVYLRLSLCGYCATTNSIFTETEKKQGNPVKQPVFSQLCDSFFKF